MVKKQQQLQIEIMYSRLDDIDTVYVINRDPKSDGLDYNQIIQYRNQYMREHNIFTDVKMSYLNQDEDILPLNQQFFLSYDDLSKIFEGNFVILLSPEIDEIESKIRNIEQKLFIMDKELQNIKKVKNVQEEVKKEMFMKKHTSLSQNIKRQMSELPTQKLLDIGVLFSEPLVQKRDDTQEIKVLGEPVKYKEEIQRLKRSLNKTARLKINLKCSIASVDSLKNLFKQKVQILHLICHGSIETQKKTQIQEGVLQFEQQRDIGCMDKIYGRQIPQLLDSIPTSSKPKLIFINACHSELIGDAFLKSGIPFVIVIQSSQKIQDTAAQLFADRFYHSLFNGVGVKDSFEDAKDSLNRQNRAINSNICCCIHTTSHQPKCLFQQLCEENTKEFVHNLYHIPSCTCSKRHLNVHQNDCVWAINTLFAINKQFRIATADGFRKPNAQQLSEYDDLYICCCSNQDRKIPHDETQKFKFKHDKNVNPNQVLYQPCCYTDFEVDISDETSIELKGNLSKSQKLFGRNLNIYALINDIKKQQQPRVVLVYGCQGSGKSKVVTRAVQYMYERGHFQSQYIYLDMGNVTNSIDFNFQIIKTFKHMKLNNVIEIYVALKTSKIAIIMDNLDMFVKVNYLQFKSQIQKMIKKMNQSKIILIMNQNVVKTLQSSILKQKRFYLEPLKKFAAADMFILHSKDYLKDINMRQVWNLFENQKYRVPKTILDMVHFIKRHFSIVTKVSLSVVIQQMAKRDTNEKQNDTFLQLNISQLQKDPELFKIFLFLCEFKDGLSQLDFNIMSNSQGEEIHQESALLPQNWKQIICRLIYYDRQEQEKLDEIVEGNYYFCDVLSVGEFKKVRVKKYMLDFMKKNESYKDQNMTFNALAYISIFSMTILKIMRDQYQHHQKIIEYCNISNAGIFQFQRQFKFASFFDEGEYFPDAVENLSKSTRKSNDIDKGIKKLFQKRNSLYRVNPTSVFLHQTNIKELYKTDYMKYYKQLSGERQKLFRYYFLSLMINVPSNIMVANDDANKQFLKYCLDKSISIVKNLSDKPSKTINLCMIKLYMMKLVVDLETMEFPDMAMFKPHFESIENIMTIWNKNQEVFKVILMDCHLLRLGILYKQMKVNGKPETYADILDKYKWFKDVYETSSQNLMGNLILNAKTRLLLAQSFFFTRQKVKQNYTGFYKFKANYEYIKKHKALKQAAEIFRINNLKLLEVRTMVKVARLQFSIVKQKGIDSDLSDFFRIKSYISQIRDISNNPNYNIVLKQSQTQLNDLQPKVTRIIQQKTLDYIIFMKSAPLTSKSQNNVINTVKRTHNFKAMIEQTFQESLLDDQIQKNKQVSVRFQILTFSTCINILKQGCSIVVLSIDAIEKQNQIFLYFQQDDLPKEDKVEIKQFLSQINLDNIKLVIICGKNAKLVGEKIQQVNKGTAVVITASYNSDYSDKQLEHYYDMGYYMYSWKTIQKIAFSTLIKNLLEKIIYSKTPVKSYHIAETVQGAKELTIYYLMRFSKQTSDPQVLRSVFDVRTHFTSKDNGSIELQFKAGTYHNISTQRSTLNNLKELDKIFVGRQKILLESMEEIIDAKKQSRPCYINLFGSKSTGKSSFLKELANNLVQRGFYKKGIYYLDGTQISKQFDGNLGDYLQKNKTTIFQITFFNEQYIENTSQMLVIIDDFHLIKQKSQYLDYFFNAIISKKVNLILASDEKLNMKQIPLFGKKRMLDVQIKKLSQQQSPLISYCFIPLYNFEQYKKLYKQTFFKLKKEKNNVIPQTSIEQFKQLLYIANQQPQVGQKYINYKLYMQSLKKFSKQQNIWDNKNFLQVPEYSHSISKSDKKNHRKNHYSQRMKLSKKASGNKLL